MRRWKNQPQKRPRMRIIVWIHFLDCWALILTSERHTICCACRGTAQDRANRSCALLDTDLHQLYLEIVGLNVLCHHALHIRHSTPPHRDPPTSHTPRPRPRQSRRPGPLLRTPNLLLRKRRPTDQRPPRNRRRSLGPRRKRSLHQYDLRPPNRYRARQPQRKPQDPRHRAH